jgi:hypothetical protein
MAACLDSSVIVIANGDMLLKTKHARYKILRSIGVEGFGFVGCYTALWVML